MMKFGWNNKTSDSYALITYLNLILTIKIMRITKESHH